MVSKVFNVGVVGYGLSAKVFHIPFIATTPQLVLYSIVQRTPKDGSSAPQDFPALKHYTDIKPLIADPKVDVVVITTPPNTHFEFTKAALEAGKHVLTEKPFVPTSAQANELYEIAKANNRILCVFQNRRWDSDFLAVKHLLAQGTLGNIIEYNSHYDRFAPSNRDSWKGQLGLPDGGSVFFDLGTHLVDQAYTLFGMPSAVYGRVFAQKPGNADFIHPDSVTAELVYPDGKAANIRFSAHSIETTQRRFWIRGTKGSFHKDGLDLQEPQIIAGAKPTDEGFGKDPMSSMSLNALDKNGVPEEIPVPDLKPETYMAFYNAFGEAVKGGKEKDVPVKASEARDVLRILEAVLESSKTGKVVAI